MSNKENKEAIMSPSDADFLLRQTRNISMRIKAVRGRVTRDEFAVSLNVHKRTLQRYEIEDGRPDSVFLTAICERYGVNPTWLLLGEGEMYRKSVGPLGVALVKGRGSRSVEEMAAILGIESVQLHRYEQGIEIPDERFQEKFLSCAQGNRDELARIMGFGVKFAKDVADLEERFAAQQKRETIDTQLQKDIRDGYVRNGGGTTEFAFIPLYDVEVSAGHGSVPAGEEINGEIAFRLDWLRCHGLRENHLVTVTACGDSMEPTMRDGDLLLVNTQARDVGKDAIYVIRRDDHVFAKRIQRMFSGDLYIRSDNPAYATETVKADSGHDIQIIGRVVWIGHEL